MSAERINHPSRTGQRRILPRWWLRAVGVGAPLVLAYLDDMAGRRVWPASTSQLHGLRPNVSEATLAFGGLGSTGVAEQATAMARILPENVGYVDYSSTRVNTQELAGLVRERARGLRTVHLNGHSMGGPLGLEVLRRAELPDLRLGHVVLHCSPFDISDARNGSAAWVGELCRWPVGPAGKFMFSLTRTLLERRSPLLAWRQARGDALQGCSPRLWLSQVKELRSLKLEPYVEDYRHMVGPQTRVWYCMPEDPRQDLTVDTERAAGRYERFFGDLGVPFTVWHIPDSGHAEVEKAANHIERALAAGRAGNGYAAPPETLRQAF